MAIVNRDKDVSEQKEVVTTRIAPTVTAATYMLHVLAYPAELQAVQQAANGLSGAPFHYIDVYRFIPGAGATTITGLHASMAVTAVGTSGVQGFSLIAAGSTLLQLQAKDVLVLRTAVANTAATDVTVSLVVKKLQDIVSYYGA